MEKPFYCAFQIDCEATQHAVNDAALGERASRAVAEILESQGMRGTFLVIPGDAQASGGVYRELRKHGHEVGLHVHPADLGYEEFIGVYGPDTQREILQIALDRFAQAMDYRPESVCIGYASGNDYTFSVLAELGFRQGMLSIPTRVLPQCASVWAGGPLDMHYAHAYNRLLPGRLDLVNVPLTIDPDSRMWGGAHPQDLRIELVDAKNHWYTIQKEVSRKVAKDVPVKYVLALTHNIYDYRNEHDFRRETLLKVIRDCKKIITSAGYAPAGATMREIAQEFRQKCPLNQAAQPTLKLDTRGRE